VEESVDVEDFFEASNSSHRIQPTEHLSESSALNLHSPTWNLFAHWGRGTGGATPISQVIHIFYTQMHLDKQLGVA